MPAKTSRCANRRKRIVITALITVLVYLRQKNQLAIQQAGNLSMTKKINLYRNDQFIPLNNKSQMTADVANIVHIPNEAKILVRFDTNRTCLQPQLIGRLSGKLLSKIQWTYDENKTDMTRAISAVGQYNVPSPGEYFIEIILTMCNELDLNSNAKNICLIHPAHHRLTHDNATIDAVYLPTKKEDKPTPIGIWYHKSAILRNYTVPPMYTRYQPQNCRPVKTHMLDRCKGPMDTTRFMPYEFEFRRAFRLQDDLPKKEESLCFMGASHSGVLMQFSRRILKSLGIEHINIFHLKYSYLANFTDSAMLDAKENCNKVVIGVGQWDGSRQGGAPTSFLEFRRLLAEAMSVVIKPLMDANVEVYFRNMQ